MYDYNDNKDSQCVKYTLTHTHTHTHTLTQVAIYWVQLNNLLLNVSNINTLYIIEVLHTYLFIQ